MTLQKAAPRPTSAEQEEWSSYGQLQHTLPTHGGEGTAMQCSAISSHTSRSTGHVALCDQPQPTAPTSSGRAPARGCEAEDLVESPLPPRRARVGGSRGLGEAPVRAGQTVFCVFFVFLCLAGGEKEIGEPYYAAHVGWDGIPVRATAVASAAAETLPWPFGLHVAG